MTREIKKDLPYISKKDYFFGIMKQFHIQLDTLKSTGEVRFYKKGKKYFMTVLMVKVYYEEGTDKLIVANYEADFKTGSTTKFTSYSNLKTPQDSLVVAGNKVKTFDDINKVINLDKFINTINDKWKAYAGLMNQDPALKPRIETKKFREAPIKGGDMIHIDHIMMHSKLAQDTEYFKEDWMALADSVEDIDQSENYPEEINAKLARIDDILNSGDEEAIGKLFHAIVNKGVEEVDV